MRRALVIGALLISPAPASAADFTVNSNLDNATCTTTCTLRGALTAAQANGTATQDTINLPADTYQLSSQFGALPVTANLVVKGLGSAANTRIVGSGASRLLSIAATAQPPSPQTQLLNVTMTGGRALTDTDPFGGNILIAPGANVLLDHVRVTDGFGLRGGGIAARGGNATLTISNSLIDNNQAQVSATGATTNADGGGILMLPQPAAAATFQNLQVTDSTFAFNRARQGGGISATGTINQSRLERVTLAYNQATSFAGGALFLADAESFQVGSSIFAGNSGVGPGGQNCGTIVPFDLGANVESAQDCNFTLASDRRNTTAGLATALNTEGVLTIPLDSVARDLAGACTGTDQRGVARPQGAACDAGAYEVVAPIVTPTPTPTPTPSATPTPTPVATPVAGKLAVAREVKGKVRVRVPGSKGFVDLDTTEAIPVNATLDTKAGTVELKVVPKAGAPVETAQFFDGIFKLTQKGGITDLKLTEQLAPCRKGASAAAKKPKTRRLWGSGKGHFRTSGRLSSATVRGTKWLVQDSCAGTLTRVTQGSVLVRDAVLRKNAIVRAPHSYTARQKRR